MPWYAAFSPAFFAFFATPPATRIPVPDMTTVTRVRRAARLEVCEAAATSLVSEKTKPPLRAPSARRARPADFLFLRHRVPGRTHKLPRFQAARSGESLKIDQCRCLYVCEVSRRIRSVKNTRQ